LLTISWFESIFGFDRDLLPFLPEVLIFVVVVVIVVVVEWGRFGLEWAVEVVVGGVVEVHRLTRRIDIHSKNMFIHTVNYLLCNKMVIQVPLLLHRRR